MRYGYQQSNSGSIIGALFKFAFWAATIIFLIVIGPILGVLGGAFCGWIVSLTPLEGWVLDGIAQLGVAGKISLVDLGAMLGFVSGFLKTKVSGSSSS